MKKLRCPKCDSDNVLVGNEKFPNRCADCDHKWDINGQEITIENIICFKSPEILATFNRNLKRNSLERRLRDALFDLDDQG